MRTVIVMLQDVAGVELRHPLRVDLLVQVGGELLTIELDNVVGTTQTFLDSGAFVRGVHVLTLDGREVPHHVATGGDEIATADRLELTVEMPVGPRPLSGPAAQVLVGVVVDNVGAPVGGAQVRVIDSAESVRNFTDELGRVSVSVGPGPIEIEVSLETEACRVWLPPGTTHFEAVLDNLEVVPGDAGDVWTRLPTDDTFREAGIYSQDLGGSPEALRTPDRSVDESESFVVVRLEEPSLAPRAVARSRSVAAAVEHPPEDAPDETEPSDDSTDRVFVKALDRKQAVTRTVAEPAAGRSKTGWRVALPRGTEELFKQAIEEHRDEVFTQVADLVGASPRRRVNAANPIAWYDPGDRREAATVARGHLVRFVQRWQADGYSLGRLLHSLPLAPGQYKSVAIVDWRRDEAASQAEYQDMREALTATSQRERLLNEDMRSVLDESLRGTSSSFTFGAGAGIGSGSTGSTAEAGSSTMGGGAVGVGYATASAEQDSHRELGASLQQEIRDRTAQAASAVRSQRTTVVRTVSQSERAEAVTEVIANHNRNHAMTVLYFEVLRHVVVSTEVADVTPCLFIPLSTFPFSVPSVQLYRESLERALLEPSLRPAFEACDRLARPTPQAGADELTSVAGSFEIEMAMPKAQPVKDGEGTASRQDSPAPRGPYDGLAVRVIGRENSPWVDAALTSEASGPDRWRCDFATAGHVGGHLMDLRGVELTFREPGTIVVGQVRIVDLEVAAHSRDGRSATRRLRGTLPLRGDRLKLTMHSPTATRHDRDADAAAVERLVRHLNNNRIHYFKQIWSEIDRDELFAMLDERLAPGNGGYRPSLATVVQPRLVGFVGNSMVLPMVDGAKLSPSDPGRAELKDQYQAGRAEQKITLPTGGVFAEAVLGASEAAERIDDSRFWKWDEHPLDRPAEMAPVSTDSRTRDVDLSISPTGPAIISMQDPVSLPDPTGMASGLQTVGQAGIFRDVTAVDRVTQNSIDALRQAVQSAQALGEKAGENATKAFTSFTEAQTERHRAEGTQRDLQSLEQARRSGLVTDPQAREIAAQILRRSTGVAAGGRGAESGHTQTAHPSGEPGSTVTTPEAPSTVTGEPSGAGASSRPASPSPQASARRSTHRPRSRPTTSASPPPGAAAGGGTSAGGAGSAPGGSAATGEGSPHRELEVVRRRTLQLQILLIAGVRESRQPADRVGRVDLELVLGMSPGGIIFPLRSRWWPNLQAPYSACLELGAEWTGVSTRGSGSQGPVHRFESTFELRVNAREISTAVSSGITLEVPFGDKVRALAGGQAQATWGLSQTSVARSQGGVRVDVEANSGQGDLWARFGPMDMIELGEVELAARLINPPSGWWSRWFDDERPRAVQSYVGTRSEGVSRQG